MVEYVQGVEELDPDWLVRFDETASSRMQSTTPFGGVSVSSMINTEAHLDDAEKTLFDWVKEGEERRVKSWLRGGGGGGGEKNGENAKSLLHSVDENGMTVLHWCCDRGHATIARLLLEEGEGCVGASNWSLLKVCHYFLSIYLSIYLSI